MSEKKIEVIEGSNEPCEIDRFISSVSERDAKANGPIDDKDNYVRGAVAVLYALGFDDDMDMKVGGTDD